jgi:hypothetical protein
LRYSCYAEVRRGGAEERGGVFDIRLKTVNNKFLLNHVH